MELRYIIVNYLIISTCVYEVVICCQRLLLAVEKLCSEE